MTQMSLLADVQRAERPWKVVRRVSKLVYLEIRKSGRAGRMTIRVLVALAAYRNATMQWPTAGELTAWMFTQRRIARHDSRLVAPRLTELVRGRVVRLQDGSKARIGGGLLTLLPTRRCRVTGARAHPVAIREAGSREREVA